MALPKTERAEPEGFDIVCRIGRVVYEGLSSGESAHEVAFKLIARHDAEGVFEFLNTRVTVERIEEGKS